MSHPMTQTVAVVQLLQLELVVLVEPGKAGTSAIHLHLQQPGWPSKAGRPSEKVDRITVKSPLQQMNIKIH